MAAMTDCPTCGYPLTVQYEGQSRICEYCSTPLTAEVNESISQVVGIPSGLFWGLVGLTMGVLFGPAILGSTQAGSKWLEKQARTRLER